MPAGLHLWSDLPAIELHHASVHAERLVFPRRRRLGTLLLIGEPCCNGACTDITTNVNCGECSVACDAGTVCTSGTCQPALSCSTASVLSPCSKGDGGPGVFCDS